jgi:hypothetical protein
MKKYLTSIKSGGACASIAFYADTPAKNYRVYYNGSDIGLRYEYIGNAARHLERVALLWLSNGAHDIRREYTPRDQIPRRGSNA